MIDPPIASVVDQAIDGQALSQNAIANPPVGLTIALPRNPSLATTVRHNRLIAP